MELTTAKEICPTTTLGRVKEGSLLVDVREDYQVQALAFDVPNLLHIPFSEFEARFNEVPKDQEVIMVCTVGQSSLKTTYYLLNHGWTNVVNMQHGLARWSQKGFPTKGDTSTLLGTTDAGCGCGSTTDAKTTEEASCCSSSNDNSSCC